LVYKPGKPFGLCSAGLLDVCTAQRMWSDCERIVRCVGEGSVVNAHATKSYEGANVLPSPLDGCVCVFVFVCVWGGGGGGLSAAALPLDKQRRYALSKRLGGPQSRSGRFGVEKIPFTCRKPNDYHRLLVRSIVTANSNIQVSSLYRSSII
jgi:hypothetical protein